MRLKGLHNIKTHSMLARRGQLISAARNLHRLGSHKSEGRNISDDFRPASMASLHRELFLENKIRLYQIEVIRDFLHEMRQAKAEGIPVAPREFHRLTKRLAELEAG